MSCSQINSITIILHTFVLISIITVSNSQFNPFRIFNSNNELQEEANLDAPELIAKHGYRAEEHVVETEDGYLIKVHRIPYGKKRKASNLKNNPPVLLMHGLLSSSSDWILTGPKKAFGYILADEGFDVWMGNARGNYYSKNHTTLDPQNPAFWNFTFHEIGFYDVPALIDYILNETRYEQLHYIGYSQGCTVFFVMTSLKESYNDKIVSMNSFGPAMYNASTLGSLTNFFNRIGYISNSAKDYVPREVNPRKDPMIAFAAMVCGNIIPFYFCRSLLFSIVGQSGQFNETLVPVYAGHAPAGASSLQFTHYNQFYLTGEFKQFDYGAKGNKIKYGESKPPFYDLKKVKSPVTIHYGQTDTNINNQFLDRLENELGNCLGKKRIKSDLFNHLDFIWGMDAWKLLYRPVINSMKKYSVGKSSEKNSVMTN